MRELVIQPDVEQKLMILHLVVQQRALRLFDGSDEVAEGIELAEPDIHGQAPQPQRIVILVVVGSEGALPAELVKNPLARTPCYVALRVSFLESAADGHCGEK